MIWYEIIHTVQVWKVILWFMQPFKKYFPLHVAARVTRSYILNHGVNSAFSGNPESNGRAKWHGTPTIDNTLELHIARSSIVSIVFHFASRGLTKWNLQVICPWLVRGCKKAMAKLDERRKSQALTRKPNQVWGCVFKIFGNYKLKCDEPCVICARMCKGHKDATVKFVSFVFWQTRFFQLVPYCSWHYQPGKLSKALNAVQCTLYFEAEGQQAAQREGAGGVGRSKFVGWV